MIVALAVTLNSGMKERLMHLCMFPLAGRVRTLCIPRLQCLPYER